MAMQAIAAIIGSYMRTASESLRANVCVMVGCVFVIAVAAFAICAEQTAYLLKSGFTPGYMDSLMWLFSSHRGVPLLWCIAPASFMVWLTVARGGRRGANWAVRHDRARDLWVEDIFDVVIGAVIFSVATMISACAAAAVFSGGATADFGPHGICAAITNQVPSVPPDDVIVTVSCAVLAFLVLVVFGTAFQFGSFLLSGPVIPFVALTILGLPSIHGPQAFLVDAARLLNASVDPSEVTNPLSLPFSESSVFYDSWLSGSDHGFWLQVVFFAILFIAGLVLAPRKEYVLS